MSILIALLILNFYISKNFDDLVGSLYSDDKNMSDSTSKPEAKHTDKKLAGQTTSQFSPNYEKNPDGNEYTCFTPLCAYTKD